MAVPYFQTNFSHIVSDRNRTIYFSIKAKIIESYKNFNPSTIVRLEVYPGALRNILND